MFQNHEEIIKRLSCDEDVFSSTFLSKSTTDWTKETDTQSVQTAWTDNTVNTVNTVNRDGSMQTTKGWSWDPYEPQTRHRRDTNPSSPGTTQSTALDEPDPDEQFLMDNFSNLEQPNHTRGENLLAEEISTRGNVVTDNFQQYIRLPDRYHSYHLATEEAQKLTKADITTTFVDDPIREPFVSQQNLSSSQLSEEPLIIITGEAINRSLTENSSEARSGSSPKTGGFEGPERSLVLQGPEALEVNGSDPLVVSLRDDIIVNEYSPSLSPVEVIDIDVLEVNKPTSKATFLQDHKVQEPSQTVLPFQKTSKNNLSSMETVAVFSSKATPSFSQQMTQTTQSAYVIPMPEEKEKYIENVGELEEEKGEESEVPQRPNRGRLFTHSNHPSFYPYFLNRVLG